MGQDTTTSTYDTSTEDAFDKYNFVHMLETSLVISILII
jgi:hypothetical protein